MKYSYGPYNKIKGDKQWIRLTEGCPHDCPFCYEPKEKKVFPIPEIIRNKVGIIDMNLLCKKEALQIIKDLGQERVNGKVVSYELICGVDYRFLTDEIAAALKKSRFSKIRIAWDWWYGDQIKIRDGIKKIYKAGYRAKDIMIFVICNWKIPYQECLDKLDICKVWNVKVCDCYFDNQIKMRAFKPIHWTKLQMRDFRRRCRKHNQLINFGIDPEIKNRKKTIELF